MKSIYYLIIPSVVLFSCGQSDDSKPTAKEMSIILEKHEAEQRGFERIFKEHNEYARRYYELGDIESGDIEMEKAQQAMDDMAKNDSLWKIKYDELTK